MSRGQQAGILSTAKSNSSTDQGNANSSFDDTQNDIQSYSKNLQAFVSGNPYVSGGEYEHTINPGLANVSDAGSNSLKGALQSQVLRTGQNSAADAATAKSGAQQNTRDLSASLASADQGRINSETGYNTTALGATATPISAESNLYGTSLGGGNSALNTGESAAATPSFWDEVGGGLASGLGGALTAGAGAYGKAKGCWIAAATFDGWGDYRTHLVRNWVFGPVESHYLGKYIARLYLRFGEQAAQLMRSNRLIRCVLTNLCHYALRQAQKGIQNGK